MSDFKIYTQGSDQFIESLSFPRFKGKITFGPLSDIEDIDLIDKNASVGDMARVMREAGEFIIKNTKK